MACALARCSGSAHPGFRPALRRWRLHLAPVSKAIVNLRFFSFLLIPHGFSSCTCLNCFSNLPAAVVCTFKSGWNCFFTSSFPPKMTLLRANWYWPVVDKKCKCYFRKPLYFSGWQYCLYKFTDSCLGLSTSASQHRMRNTNMWRLPTSCFASCLFDEAVRHNDGLVRLRFCPVCEPRVIRV